MLLDYFSKMNRHLQIVLYSNCFNVFISESLYIESCLKFLSSLNMWAYRSFLIDYSCIEVDEAFYHFYILKINDLHVILLYKSLLKIVISITKNFLVANWLEREVFDLYGHVFIGHQNLKHLLTEFDSSVSNPFLKSNPLIFTKNS